jgi:hypothetical protein
MSWLGIFLVPVGSVISVVFVWNFVLALLLRPFGVTAPLSLYLARTQSSKPLNRFLLHGVVIWSLPLLLIFELERRFLNEDISWSPAKQVVACVAVLFAGVLFAYLTTKLSKSPSQ